jgi:long-subunit acyl-CoA synthetase (AMP-forming)
VSNAAKIRKWFFIKDDFSIPGGEFTPTLKVKRKIVLRKYAEQVEALYHKPSL